MHNPVFGNTSSLQIALKKRGFDFGPDSMPFPPRFASPYDDPRARVRELSWRAFSSEVDTGSREENTSKTKARARF
jgi:hypothetical protein